MLLIAQPKSASTSLAKTIAKIGNLNCSLGIPENKENYDIPCMGYACLQGYHDNMIERSPLFLKQVITGRKTIFKEHLLPTDRHLEIVKRIKCKIVILLRNPEHSLDSYKRIKGIKIKDEKKLLTELEMFHDRWQWFKSNKANIMLVYFEDLILNYKSVMKKILKHYGVKGRIVNLMKFKYTGVGAKRVINSSTEKC